MISGIFASMLMLLVCFTAGSSFAQTKSDSTSMKDCCMMKDGKMVHVKDGKMMPMEKDMTMKNGTKCMTNGECVMKDGKKMKMNEGECMDMDGKMDMCTAMMKDTKGEKNKKMSTYECPMHPEVTSDKAGKCSKCGMALVEKKVK